MIFELDEDTFFGLTKKVCFYCKKKPYKKVSKSWPDRNLNGDYTYNGIDRKNNDMGYTINNCVSCCSKCNYLKGSLNYKEFINHVKLINKYIGK